MKNLRQSLLQMGLNEDLLHQFALVSNFKKRVRKLSGLDFILIILQNSCKDVMSYNTLASSFSQTPSKCVNRQALHKAMKNTKFLDFIDMVFEHILLKKMGIVNIKYKSMFDRIVIQDSTIINLPSSLLASYSGIRNQHKQVANSRIQLVIDILKNKFIGFSIDPYSKTDVQAASDLKLKKKDLLLRDRGYLSIKEIIRIITSGASFIFRYHFAYNYSDINTGEVLDLYQILKKEGHIDKKVRLGSKNGPIVRLMALPIDEKTADHRKWLMKRGHGNNPSKKRLALLSWSIYITNIHDNEVTYSDIFELYKLRWRIEIIFKALKSNLKLDSIHNVSEIQLQFIIKAKIIMLILTMQFVYQPLVNRIKKLFNKELSLLKLVRYIIDNDYILSQLIKEIEKGKRMAREELKLLAYYCCYDKRKRNNHERQLIKALS